MRRLGISLSLLVGILGVHCAAPSFGTLLASGANQHSDYIPSLTSYSQVRYTELDSADDQLSLRRFKAIIEGGSSDRLRYHLQFIYKANNRSVTDDRVFLQDAYLVFLANRVLSFKAGQFVPPFGLERSQPDWNLDFVGRTDVTKRLVVNSNLGRSFARDRGLECNWDPGSWRLSFGIFQGAGTNNPSRGNGPLEVVQVRYEREGTHQGRQWSWRAGLAGSNRRAADLDFAPQLPGLDSSQTSHFRGQDRRLNVFVQGRWGPLRAQGEVFRVWLDPTFGSDILATGAYAQVAYLPVSHVILALRHECFNPNVSVATASSVSQWTAAATYDFAAVPLRFATDFSRARGRSGFRARWRIQVQYFLIRGFRLG
ncbi:MAG: porin [Acidobacteriota bacterium]|jgi:hypothetical protein